VISDTIAWLLADRARYRDRCALTLADVREHGVTRREIREYLRDRGWTIDALETGDKTTPAWRQAPPTWSHPDHSEPLDLRGDDAVIKILAGLELRSPWAILDDMARYAPQGRDVYHDEQIAGTFYGPQFVHTGHGHGR